MDFLSFIYTLSVIVLLVLIALDAVFSTGAEIIRNAPAGQTVIVVILISLPVVNTGLAVWQLTNVWEAWRKTKEEA